MNVRRILPVTALTVAMMMSAGSQTMAADLRAESDLTILYLGATECEELKIENDKNFEITSVAPEDPTVVEVQQDGDMYRLKPLKTGETRIAGTFKRLTGISETFYCCVKVIDPARPGEMFVRHRNGQEIPDGAEGMMVYDSDGPDDNAHFSYTAMQNDNGNCYETHSNPDILFGDSETLVCAGYSRPNTILMTFNKSGEKTYTISNRSGYTDMYLKFNSSTLGFEKTSTPQTVTLETSDDDCLKIHFTSDKNQNPRLVYYNTGYFRFQYSYAADPQSKNYYLPELYLLQDVAPYQAPVLDGISVKVDGTDVTNTANIKLADGEHTMTFENVPHGVRLYYMTTGKDGDTRLDPVEGAAQNGYIRVPDGGITISNQMGSVTYYAEAHGLQSDKVTKNISMTTDVSGIELDSDPGTSPIYYDLNGLRVQPVTPGLYIRRTASGTEKILR